ncbi:hypothetical protein A2631_00265 [Candidatus Daviesbacteria bacterium RIFCSPHIGHO2_01_FULL_44_29]|uniref:Uncharacterized protein n=1 Tax=Candidatus Daviesbacteria bacterium RIFCSPHIGHO2_02_FULL_43_12 TaxID=1797776 RepID=A0A1F5KFZ7_9BACT|nr:MAG: hypothetical protein A2631_00265 [Candidatus Daviesbacteria bacterium RIFCSPHIGHO2_01_FULL_44_29]OGE39779.1 MAG: hypothetical protein A3D25_03575 [Candidatus Daviesbacteria bacterium RIFCSPHIGHO2_02_FULL_43_12]OGE69930.1 MAG: hypothetical protein A3B55_04510 [Candidatus Daviesbacteria bacterium RIFCSPLOWO2_01_FULL_43_15]
MENISLVILAGGLGTRFLPLTETTPKPLIRIANKPALEHNLEKVAQHFSEIVLLIGYLKEEVQKYFGDSYKGVPIRYIDQIEYLGTGHALNSVKEYITYDDFILMYGDDLYAPIFVEKLLKIPTSAVIGKVVENWQQFGVFKLKDGNLLDSIVEKPTEYVGNLVNIGLYKLNKKILPLYDQITKSPRGEFEFTDMLSLFAKDNPVEVIQVESGWIPLSYPWDILKANKELLSVITTNIEGTVEAGVTVKGELVLGKGSTIKNGAYLEGNFVIGENCIIGPNCFLKEYASIGNDCVIGNAVEITRSIIGNKTYIRHLSYVADSIIGNNVNLAGGTIVSTLKHTETGVKMMINGSLVDTGLKKLGTIIGDNAKTGINTSIYPGRKIASGAWTLPGEVVDKDKEAE